MSWFGESEIVWYPQIFHLEIDGKHCLSSDRWGGDFWVFLSSFYWDKGNLNLL